VRCWSNHLSHQMFEEESWKSGMRKHLVSASYVRSQVKRKSFVWRVVTKWLSELGARLGWLTLGMHNRLDHHNHDAPSFGIIDLVC